MRIAIVDDIAEERRLLHDKLEKALNRQARPPLPHLPFIGQDHLFGSSCMPYQMQNIIGFQAADCRVDGLFADTGVLTNIVEQTFAEN